jgi:predicted membrane-bound mannosyltransferase
LAFQRAKTREDSSFCIMKGCVLALALGASAFENSYLNNIAKRAVQANTATMDNARVAKDSASYLESLPQASTPTATIEATVAAPSYLESLPKLEAAVAAPAAVKPTPTPAELAAAAAPVKLASGAEADFAAQCVAVHKSNFRRACHDRLICAQVRR